MNPDGWGVMYADGGDIFVERGMDKKGYIEAVNRLSNRDLAIHTRISTCAGTINLDNTHPFKVTRGLYLMHNGILSIDRPNKLMSDTWHFAQWLRPIIAANRNMLGKPKFQTFLEDKIGTNNKMVLMNGEGKVVILNEGQGSWYKGLWLSNRHSLYTPRCFSGKGRHNRSYSYYDDIDWDLYNGMDAPRYGDPEADHKPSYDPDFFTKDLDKRADDFVDAHRKRLKNDPRYWGLSYEVASRYEELHKRHFDEALTDAESTEYFSYLNLVTDNMKADNVSEDEIAQILSHTSTDNEIEVEFDDDDDEPEWVTQGAKLNVSSPTTTGWVCGTCSTRLFRTEEVVGCEAWAAQLYCCKCDQVVDYPPKEKKEPTPSITDPCPFCLKQGVLDGYADDIWCNECSTIIVYRGETLEKPKTTTLGECAQCKLEKPLTSMLRGERTGNLYCDKKCLEIFTSKGHLKAIDKKALELAGKCGVLEDLVNQKFSRTEEQKYWEDKITEWSGGATAKV